MLADEVAKLFTRSNGDYLFARWGRPIAPVVFGVEEQTLSVVKGAVEAVVALAGHKMAETDPELGANLMFFFFKEWDELPEVPHLDQMIPELVEVVKRLKSQRANQYRFFRFDENGSIKAVFVFLQMDPEMFSVPAETLALSQAAQVILLWSDQAFERRQPLMMDKASRKTVLRPDIAEVIRVGYDPVLPDMAEDNVHAMRLAARMEV